MRHELCSVDTFDTRSANETAPPTLLGFTNLLAAHLPSHTFTHTLFSTT